MDYYFEVVNNVNDLVHIYRNNIQIDNNKYIYLRWIYAGKWIGDRLKPLSLKCIDILRNEMGMGYSHFVKDKLDKRMVIYGVERANFTQEKLDLVNSSLDFQKTNKYESDRIKRIITKLEEDIKEWNNRLIHRQFEDITSLKLLKEGKVLTNEQKELIRQSLSYNRVILATKVSTGKTAMSLTACSLFITDILKSNKTDCKVLIVCPKTLQEGWRISLEEEELSGEVVSYDTLSNLAKCAIPGKVNYKRLMKPFTCIIFDECHALINTNTKRHVSIKKYMKTINPDFAIGLTGTPISNTPDNIRGILSAITDHPIGNLNASEFEFIYGRNLIGFELENLKQEISNKIKKLKQDITGTILHHRSVSQLGLKRPKINMEFIEIIPDEKFLKEYNLKKNNANILEVYNSAGEKMFINDTIQSLRVMCAEYKVNYTVKWAKENNGGVVFSHFNERFLNKVGEILGREVMTGKMNTAERYRYVKEFVDGNEDLFLCQISTGGAGLNLQVKDKMWINDAPWSIAGLEQSIGRIARVGSPYDEVTIYMPYIKNSIEDIVVIQKLRNKQITVDGILDDPTGEIGKQFDFHLSAKEYILN